MWVVVRIASPRRFYRVPTIYVLRRIYEKYLKKIYLKNQFLEVKFSAYLNRRVFVIIFGWLENYMHMHAYEILLVKLCFLEQIREYWFDNIWFCFISINILCHTSWNMTGFQAIGRSCATEERPLKRYLATGVEPPRRNRGPVPLIASLLPHVAGLGLREQALWYSTRFVAVKLNRKLTFCLSFFGFSINVADLFVFAETNWEYPVPKSGTKMLTV